VDKNLKEFALTIEQQKVNVFADSLPVITGYPEQLLLLFRSLIDNALKFTITSEDPILKIRYLGVEQHNPGHSALIYPTTYHNISIEDNGIGFNNEFAEKIFVIFQRLHTQQSNYRGKGMGLAIAQRVMINHGGFILARGKPGEGAVFTLYFPVTVR
jgi:signal transduction histidine kinase